MRLISLRLNRNEEEASQYSEGFQRSVSTFLETEVRPPFYCKQVAPTAFAFNSKVDQERFDAFLEDIYERMVSFLFGTERSHDAELLFFSGTDVEIATFLTEPEEEARKRSRRYMLDFRNRDKKSSEVEAPLERITGRRPLLYRGILVCPKNVLLAYAITPASNASLGESSIEMTDTDIGRYLEFRGAEAVDFSNRIYDKASYLLQTATDEMKSIVLLVPICYNSLLSPHDREVFLNNMRQHPDWIRKQIILSVFNTPRQPSTSIIQRFMGEFAPYFPNIDWQVREPAIRSDTFMGCHIHSVTFDMHRLSGALRDQKLREFCRHIPQMRAQKIRAAVTGVETFEELMMCCKAGVIYASGNAVTSALKNCAPAQTIDIKELPIRELTVVDSVSSAA